MTLRTSVLLLAADPPDADALGGVPVHVAALAREAATASTVHTAHPRGGELRVERWGPRTLTAALSLDGGTGRSGGSALESAIVAALAGTVADVLHVHSPLLGALAIASAARRASVPVAVTLHDHALACENYDLLEGGERFCGIPSDPARCDRCLEKTLNRPSGAVLAHRGAMHELVSVADAVVAPSDSVLELISRVHPGVRGKTRRIDWGVPAAASRSSRSAREPGPLSIGIVGALSHEKGRKRVPELLRACRELDVTWHLFGATDGASVADITRSAPRVVAHGAYRRGALAGRIVQAGCHIALLPSIKPESFSLVLSEVTAAGLPVIASDLGALGERVRKQGLGWTFDPWAPATLSALVTDLARSRGLVDEAAARVRALEPRDEAAMARDHAALWDELSGRARDGRPPGGADAGAPAEWLRGVERAARLRTAPRVQLERLVGTLRRTDFYRDLPLRRVLSESARKRIETAASRLLRGRGSR